MGPRLKNWSQPLIKRPSAISPSMGPPRPIVAHTGRSRSASRKPAQWMMSGAASPLIGRIASKELIYDSHHLRPIRHERGHSYPNDARCADGKSRSWMSAPRHHEQTPRPLRAPTLSSQFSCVLPFARQLYPLKLSDTKQKWRPRACHRWLPLDRGHASVPPVAIERA
jgi:hypothetical protein